MSYKISGLDTYPCRAWVKFTTVSGGDGTAQTINGSGNVTSVTRVGTGPFLRINFTNNMYSNNYLVSAISTSVNGAIGGVTKNTHTRLGTMANNYVEVGFGVGGNTASVYFASNIVFTVAIFELSAPYLLLALLPNNGNTTTTWLNSTDFSPSSATMYNSPAYSSNTGYVFNGTNQYGIIPNVNGVTNFENIDNYSIEMWINPYNSAISEAIILEKVASGFGYPYSIKQLSSAIEITVYSGSGSASISTEIDIIGNLIWHHLVVVFDFSNKILTGYMNKIAFETASLTNITSSISNTGDVSIGRRIETNNLYYEGAIRLIRIYNRALTQSEINTHYNEYSSF